jgi:hypothetical protein
MRNSKIVALLATTATVGAASLALAPAASADTASCTSDINHAIFDNAAALAANKANKTTAARQSNLAVEKDLVNGLLSCLSQSLPGVTANLLGATIENTGALLANGLTTGLNAPRAKIDALQAENNVDAILHKALAAVAGSSRAAKAAAARHRRA